MVKLDGSIELAPLVGLAERIVDLVQSGETLRANGLVEVAEILTSTARLIVNRASLKTQHARVNQLITAMREAVAGRGAADQASRAGATRNDSEGLKRRSAASRASSARWSARPARWIPTSRGGSPRSSRRCARRATRPCSTSPERFDRVTLTAPELAVRPEEYAAAERAVGEATLRSLRYAAGGSSASTASARRAPGA